MSSLLLKGYGSVNLYKHVAKSNSVFQTYYEISLRPMKLLIIVILLKLSLSWSESILFTSSKLCDNKIIIMNVKEL